MKALKKIVFACTLLIGFSILKSYAQPTLIPVDAANNIYPITFTDENQEILQIKFNEEITSLGNNTGWTLTIGGSPVGLFGPVFDPVDHNVIQFQMSVSVDYANRNDVFISYNPAASTASPKLRGASGEVAGFGPEQGVNNLKITCESWDLSKFDYSQILTEACAPVDVSFRVTYYLKSHFPNSINYSPLLIRIYANWGDGTSSNSYGTEISPGVIQEVFSHTYPDDPSTCFWAANILPRVTFDGFCSGGGLRKQFTFQNHSTDEEGDGIFEMQTDTIQVCLGQDFSEIFQDITYFNCNPQTEADYANDGMRHVRFTYGTNFAAGDRIQDILINGTPQVFPYQSPIIQYDSILVNGSPSPTGWASTDPISHVGNLGADAVGQIFEVTLENWGPCNTYNIFETNPPIVTRSYIKIVDGPVADAGPDFAICEGDNATMGGAILRTATAGFWSTSSGDGSFTNATNPSGAVYTPGSNDIATGGAWLVLTASDPVSGCPEHRDSMYLTIDPEPVKPSLGTSLPTTFCFDNGTTTVELTSSVSPNGNYAWYRNSALQPAFTTQTISLSQPIHSGNWSVRVFGDTPNACPSPFSDEETITIYALATTTNPSNTATCDDDNMTTGNASFTVTTGGAAHSRRWQRSDNNGVSWVDILGATNPADGCTYAGETSATLSISSADYPMNGFQYRMVVTTTAGSCPAISDPATLTVHPVPVIDTPPSPDEVCEGDNASFNVQASIVSGSITGYQWQRNNVNITAILDGGIYTGFNSSDLTVNNTTPGLDGNDYRVTITSNQGCSKRTTNVELTVNPLADITSQPADREICVGQNTSYSVLTDGDPAITIYQWQVSTNGGGSWANATGGVYTNSNTATLNLTNVPITHSNNLYRCILTTDGPCSLISDEALLTVYPSPNASITPASPADLCNGETISFDGNATAGTPGYTHSWTGDITPLNDPAIETPVFTAPIVGSATNYNLTYTVTDSKGCTATDNVSVVVNPAVTVNVTASSNEVCAGDAVNVNGNPGGGTPAFGHSWTGSGSGFLSASNIAAPVFTAPTVPVQTVYNLIYTATDSEGCDNSGSISITVNPLPTANIIPAVPGALCFNETLNLDGNAADGTPGYFHSWSGDVAPLNASNIENPMFTAPSVGVQTNFNLVYTLEDSKGCIATDNVSITVYPELEQAVLSGNASICAGDPSNLQVTITGGTGPYTVVLNDGTSDITVNNYISATNISTGALGATTSYTLVSVTDFNSCDATTLSGTATVIVGSVPVSAELTGGTQICFGETSPLQVVITGGAPPYIIEIDAIGILNNYTSGDDIPTGALPLGTHPYNLVSVEDNCGISISGADVDDGNPQQIVVNGLPDISGTVNNTGLICNNGTTGIILNTTVSGTVFAWTVDDGGGITWAPGKAPSPGNITDVAGIETITQNLQHSMTSPVSVDYIITSAGPAPTSCPGNTVTKTVVVEPTILITASGQTICNNSTTSIDVNTVFSGSVGQRYSWTVSAPASVSGESDGPAIGQDFDVNIEQNLQNTSTLPQTVTYTITGYTLDGGGNLACAGTPFDVQVIVEPTILVTASNATICSNNSTAIDVNTLYSGSLGQRYSWTVSAPASVSGESDGPANGNDFGTNITQTLVNTSTSPQVVTYTIRGYTLDSGGNLVCPGSITNVTITVEPEVEVTASDKTICFNSSSNLDVNTVFSGSNGVEYTWTVSAPASITGESNGPATGVDFSTNISQTLLNSANSAQTAVYTITGYTTNAGGDLVCPGTPQPVNVVVEPNILVTASDKTICNNSSTNLDVNTLFSGSIGEKYSWTVSAPAGINGASDGPVAGLGFGTNLSQTLENTTNAPLTLTYTIAGFTTDAGGNLVCSGPSIDVDITVEPDITVSASDKTICHNSSTNIDVNTVSSGSIGQVYNWTISAPVGILGASDGPVGGQAFNQNINQTLTNSSTTPLTATYTITGYTLNGLGDLLCAGPSIDVDVIVEPNIIVTATGKTICHNSSTNLDVNTVYSGINGVRYNWTVTAPASIVGESNGPALGLPFNQNIDQTLTNSSTSPQTVRYTITGYTTDGLGNLVCSGPPINVDVIVEPNVTVTASDKTICNNTSVNLDVNSIYSGSIGVRYNWTVTAPGSVNGASNGPANGLAFNQNIDQILENTSASPQTVIYNITGYTLNSGGTLECAGPPHTVNVTVEPDITIIASDKTICHNSSVDLNVNTGASGSLGEVYKWTVLAPGSVSGASDGPVNGRDFSLNIDQTLTNSSTTTQTVTYTITGYTLNSGGTPQCAGPSKVVDVIVEPNILVTASDKTICDNSSTDLDVNTLYSGSIGTRYSWTVSAPAGITGASDGPITGLGFNTNLTQILRNTTTAPLVVTYTITGYALDAGGNLICGGPSIDVDITVEPNVELTASDKTICFNTSPNIDVNSVYTGSIGVRYTWTVAAPASISGELNGPAAGLTFAQNIDHVLQNSSSSAQTAVYTITGYTVNGSGTLVCAGTPLDVDVIVEPNVIVTASDKTICNNNSVNLDVSTAFSGSNGVRYNWTVSAPGSVSGAVNGPVGGLAFNQNIDQVLLNGSTSPQTVTYTISGYTTDGLGNLICAGPSIDVDVIVEPNLVVTASDAAICFNTSTNIDVNTIYTGSQGVEYSWTVNAPVEVLGASDGPANGESFANNITQVLQNTSFTPVDVIYTITGYTTVGGNPICAGTPLDVTIQANPFPNMTITNNTPVIPTHNFTDIILTGDVAGTTFGWRVLNPGTTGATNGSGLTIGQSIQQQLINLGAAPVTVTYRIAPSANGCTGDSVDVIVQIDPDVDLTINNLKPDICTGDNTEITIESSVSGATFSWTVIDPNSTGGVEDTLVGPNTGVTIQQNLVNSGTVPIVVEYHITTTGPAPTYIVGSTQITTVTVYPKPLALPVNRAIRICNGIRSNILMNSDVANTTFTWTVIDPTGGASGATASGTPVSIGDSISQVLTNSGNLPITISYVITPTGPIPTNCAGDPVTIDVIVDPTPVANINNTAPIICSSEETSIELNASVPGTTFEYFVADPKGTGATDGTGNMSDVITQILVNNTQTPVQITYQIIPYGPGVTGCPGDAVYSNVTINPLPITSVITGIDTVCEGTSGLVFQVILTNDSYYEWNVPASLGTKTFGGSGMNSNAVIITAGSTGGTDSLWVFETNKYLCTRDTVFKPLTIIEYPVQSNITGPDEVCAESENVIYDVPNNPGSTYQWFVPVGSGIVSDPTLNQVEVNFGMVSGQIRVRETSAGGCITIHNPLNVTVHPLPFTTLNADKLSICSGETVSFVAGPAGAGYNYEFFINGSSAQDGPADIFLVDSLINNDQITVNVTTAAGCEKLSNPIQITVHDLPVVTLTSSDADNIICDNSEVSFQATSATAVSYNFFLNGSSIQNGPLNFRTTSNLNNGDEVYVEAMSAFGCFGTSNSIITIVNPLPVAEISGDNIICPGESSNLTVNITTGTPPYNATIDNGIGLINFLSTPGTVNVSPAFTTTYTLVSLEDANGCISGNLSGNLSGSATITIRDTVEILTQPLDASVCEYTDTSFTVSAKGDGLLYQWEYTDDLSNAFAPVNAGLSGHSDFSQATLNIAATDPIFDGYYYRVLVSSSFCTESSYSDTVRLFIRFNPISVTNPLDQIVCEGDATGFGVDPGITEYPVYRWQVSYDNGVSFVNLSDTAVYNGTQSDSLQITTTASRFNGYQYRVIISGDCGIPAVSGAATLVINEQPEITIQPADITICENNPVQFNTSAGQTTNPAYQWQVDMGGGFLNIDEDSVGVYSGFDKPQLDVINATSRFDGYRYRAVISGDCPLPVTSSIADLTIHELPEITLQPRDTIVCENESPFFRVNAGVTTGVNYQWQVSSNSGTTWFDLSDTAIYSGSSTNMLRLLSVSSSYDQYQYRVIISGACVPPVNSNEVVLTVRERPEIIDQPEDTIVCEDEPLSFRVNAGVTTGVLYQWQVDMNSGSFVTIGADTGLYSGFNQAELILSAAPSQINGYRYRVRVSGDCTPVQTSAAASVTVYEKAEITVQPLPKEICEESNTFFNISAGATTSPAYEWQVNSGSGFATIGSDTSIYSGTSSNTLLLSNVPSSYNGYIYRAIVRGICPETATSLEVSLIVNQKPEITLQPVNDTVCENDPAVFTVNAGLTTDAVFRWYVNKSGVWQLLTAADELSGEYTGVETSVLTVTSATSLFNGYRYRVSISGKCTPEITSETVSLIVDERPEITQQPIDRIICEDSDVSFIVQAGLTKDPEYLWEYSIDGLSWNGADMLPEVLTHTDDSLTLMAVPSTYNNYRFRVRVSGKCASPVTSAMANLTVQEKPQIDLQPFSIAECEQETVSFTVDEGVTTGATFTWQNFNGATWVVPSAAIYQGVYTNTLTINGIHSGLNGAQFRVIVGGNCSPSVISDTVVLTVYEKPEITLQPGNTEICENDSTFFEMEAGVTTNAVFKWEYFDGSNWLAATGGIFENENTNVLVLNNVPSGWNETRFRGIVSGECEPSDTTIEAVLFVRIRPTILTQPTDAVTCENVPVSISVNAGLTFSPYFQWQYHNGTNWQNTLGANYSGSNGPTLTINNPVSPMSGYAYRVQISGFCGPMLISDSISLTIEENPEIALQPVSAGICEGSDTLFTMNAGVTTDAAYIWYFNDGTVWQQVTADGVHSGFDTNTLLLNNVPFLFDEYEYYVEVSGKCGTPVNSDRVMLSVLRRAEITTQPTDTASCENTNVAFRIETGQTDGTFIQWQVNEGVTTWENIFDGGKYTGTNSDLLRLYGIDSIMTGYRYRAIVYGTCPDSVISNEAVLTVYSLPRIWDQPDDLTVCENNDATFQVMATGHNLSYSWEVYKNDGLPYQPLPDAAGLYSGTATPVLTVISPDRSYANFRYRVKINGGCNPEVTSGFAVLRIDTGPEILQQPLPDTICEFGNVSFSLSAQGTNLNYTWQENRGGSWQDLSDVGDYIGTSTNTLSIFNIPRTYSGYIYRAVISGDCPSPVTTDEVELFIKTSPVITVQPSDTSVCQDNPVEFRVSAEGSDLKYQWQISTGGPFSNLLNEAGYSGVTTSVMTIASTPVSYNNYRYRVVVSGTCTPPANSDEVILQVNSNPSITVQPVASEICEGGNTSFISAAIGPDLNYQWEVFDGSQWDPVAMNSIYSGVNSTTLSITNAPVSLNGNLYRLSVSSACLPVTSSEVLFTVNANPTATITGDGTFPFVCGGFDLALDGNASGGSGIYNSHIWTGDIFPLNTTSAEQVIFNSMISNNFNLTYTVTDNKGCKGSDIITIENDRPNAQFSSDAYPACGNLEVTFTNNSTGAASYQWHFDDGSPVVTTQDAVHGFDNLDPSGLVKYYNVLLVAESPKMCRDTSNQFITIYPKVDPTFEVAPDTACQPIIATLITQPGAASYEWNFGDGQQQNGSYTMLHEYTNTSTEVITYNITLKTTSFYGCVETATNKITVYPIPTPNFTVTPIVQTYPDATVEITNLVREGPWAYRYEFGDGSFSTEEDPVHTYAEAGTYAIVQIVTVGECSDSIGQTVVINPTPPIASFVMPEAACSPLQIQFDNQSLYANSYLWDFGDGSISTKKNPVYTYFEGGVYAVTLTVSGPGGSDTHKADIEIWPTPSVFFSNAPDSVYVNDKPVKFFNYSGDALYYSWNFDDYEMETGTESSTNTSSEFEPYHVYEFEGWKDVLLIAWNDHCRDTLLREKAVYVSPAGRFVFPNVFRPNQNGPTGGYYENLPPSEINTVFFPGVIDQVLEYNLYIYNRWGELIFESNQVNIGWDGYLKGRLARQGVYVWKVKGKYTNGKNFAEVGDVTLLH